MPLYYSAHTIACLTKQALRELMLDLMDAQEVQVRRCVSSQTGGRMLLEVEAPDLKTLERWLEHRRILSEWIMRIDLDGQQGRVIEH